MPTGGRASGRAHSLYLRVWFVRSSLDGAGSEGGHMIDVEAVREQAEAEYKAVLHREDVDKYKEKLRFRRNFPRQDIPLAPPNREERQMLDVNKVKEEAEREHREEAMKVAKEKLKLKFRERDKAKQVVANIEREIEDLYAHIGDS